MYFAISIFEIIFGRKNNFLSSLSLFHALFILQYSDVYLLEVLFHKPSVIIYSNSQPSKYFIFFILKDFLTVLRLFTKNLQKHIFQSCMKILIANRINQFIIKCFFNFITMKILAFSTLIVI